jgi:Gpi18-like mannosyltransferase
MWEPPLGIEVGDTNGLSSVQIHPFLTILCQFLVQGKFQLKNTHLNNVMAAKIMLAAPLLTSN